ncbi:MAG: restriction endonuclease subunit S [Ectothiorhodospiraceae bacterium AqS1]|nr:restriction endonuclease subunit S [Ectothiorhodospiraceae bacterium AqS1]
MSWKTEKIGNLLSRVKRAGKLKASEYKEVGSFPVIDQGDNDIAGYSDNPEIAHKFPLPIVVFGDHTRRVKLVREPFVCGADGTQLLYPLECIDPVFFYHAVKNIDLSNYFYARHFKFLKDQEISFPDLSVQKRIASILSAYDDLIENNRRRIALLEQSAQLLYREWFIHFRFPGHEATNFINGLPKSWEIRSLVEVAVNFDRRRIPLSVREREQRPGSFPYHGAAGILDYVDDFIFDGRFLLMGEDGTVITKDGHPMLQLVNGKFWVNNHAHILQGEKISTEFLWCCLNNYQISGHITGVAQPKVTQKNMNRIPIIFPHIKILELFYSHIDPVIEQIFALKYQNQKLCKARDLLLPRLMDGRIPVDA